MAEASGAREVVDPRNDDNDDDNSSDQNDLTLFSDGSHIERGCSGAGVALENENGQWTGRAVALGVLSNSVEAELCAMHEALKLAQEHLSPDHRRVFIYTDCDPARRAIKQAEAYGDRPYPVMDDILAEMDRLRGQGVEFEPLWVKAHHVCASNLLVDELARRASNHCRQILRVGPARRFPVTLEIDEQRVREMGAACETRAERKRRELNVKDDRQQQELKWERNSHEPVLSPQEQVEALMRTIGARTR